MGDQTNDMSNLVKALHAIIGDQINSFGLTDYRLGEVTAVNPLVVKISDRIFLKEKRLILTETVLEKKLDLSHLHEVTGATEDYSAHAHGVDIDSQKSLTKLITITEGLKVGDFVHLLGVAKGQKFIVLSKIREKQKVVIDANNTWKWS